MDAMDADIFGDARSQEIHCQRYQYTPILQSQYNDPDDMEAHGARPSAAMLLPERISLYVLDKPYYFIISPEYSGTPKSKVNQTWLGGLSHGLVDWLRNVISANHFKVLLGSMRLSSFIFTYKRFQLIRS